MLRGGYSKHNMRDRFCRWVRRCRYQWTLKRSRIEKDQLGSANESTPLFTLSGQHCYGRIIKSPSPDQLEIAIIYQRKVQRFKCKLYKVTTTNTRTFHNFFNTYQLVYLYCHEFTSDGKLLVDIYQTERDYRIGGSSANDLIRVESGDDPDFYV